MRAKRLSRWIGVGVVAVSVLTCVAMAAARSEGLVSVTVTALDPDNEPNDHNLPLVKQREAPPDYELMLLYTDGRTQSLGVKPNQSAADGLNWRLLEPVSTSRIMSVRLREKDVVVSDAIAEVQIEGLSVESNGYRFDFETARSFDVGAEAFFATPVGKAIALGFVIGIAAVIVSFFGI